MSLAHRMNRVGQMRKRKEQSAERRGEVFFAMRLPLCAKQIFTLTPPASPERERWRAGLILTRRRGGDYKAVGQSMGGILKGS